MLKLGVLRCNFQQAILRMPAIHSTQLNTTQYNQLRHSIRVHRLRAQSCKTANHPNSTPNFRHHVSAQLAVLLSHWLWTGGSQEPLFLGTINLPAHRSQEKHVIVTREQSDGTGSEGKVRGRASELPCPLQEHHPPSTSTCSSTRKLSEHCPFGFLCRLCFLDKSD